MTDRLPPPLLALFQPRPPLRFLPHADHPQADRRCMPITGVAAFLEDLRRPDPNYIPTESEKQTRERKKREKKEKADEELKKTIALYKPTEEPLAKGDPFRTLFVARLSYGIDENDLEREFGRFGPIERIRIVRGKDQKPRGYAFILYERERDMKAAYKETDGMHIKDRRIMVDAERARITKGWLPMRLGGGLGGRGTAQTKALHSFNNALAGAPPPRFGFRGGPLGFRGRGDGGFRGRGGSRGGRGGGGYDDRDGPPRVSDSDRGGRGSGHGQRGGIGYRGGGAFGGDRGGFRGGRGGFGGRGGHGGFSEGPGRNPSSSFGGGRGGFASGQNNSGYNAGPPTSSVVPPALPPLAPPAASSFGARGGFQGTMAGDHGPHRRRPPSGDGRMKEGHRSQDQHQRSSGGGRGSSQGPPPKDRSYGMQTGQRHHGLGERDHRPNHSSSQSQSHGRDRMRDDGGSKKRYRDRDDDRHGGDKSRRRY